MEDNKDKALPEELFGGVKKAQKKGGLAPDVDQIRRDLADQPHYICALFCTDCGFEQGLTLKGAESFFDYHEIPATPNSDTLVVVDGCQCCDSEFRNVRTMKMQPEL